MDLHMPIMDGHEATKRIRAKSIHDDTPIIAMTASAMDHERQRCLAIGMNDHIPKPIEVDEAITTMRKWMKPRDAKTEEAGVEQAATGAAPEPAPTPPPEKPAAAEDTTMLLSDLPNFDREGAMTRVAGDEKLLRKLMISFAQKNANAANTVRETLDAKDYDATFSLVHALKGAAGNLGLQRPFFAAKDFQAALEAKEVDSYDTHFDTFKTSLEEVLPVLAKLDPSLHQAQAAPEEAAAPPALDDAVKQRAIDDCNALMDAADARNMRAVSLIEDIKEKLDGKGLDGELDAVEAALMVLNFQTASEATRALLDKLGGN